MGIKINIEDPVAYLTCCGEELLDKLLELEAEII